MSRWRVPLSGVLGAALWWCPAVLGAGHQDEDPVRGGGQPGKTPITEIYLNDSFEASDAISAAQRLADTGRWSEAAELLQETADSTGDKLVQLSPRYYVGIREYIATLMSRWPKVGIAAYRDLFERDIIAAQKSLEPRAVGEALALLDRYFCTRAAVELADTIGQLAIESGDLALARQIYTRVLEHHPDAATYANRFRAMLMLVEAMDGERPAEPFPEDADTKLRWMGEDRALGEVLGEVNEAFREFREPTSPADWPIFGGQSQRNRPAASNVDVLGLAWRFEGFGAAGTPPGMQDPATKGSGEPDRPRFLTMHPIAAGGLIFVQRHREIIALHRNTGMVAWRYRADDPTVTDFNDLDGEPPGWDSPTVHENRVFAALPGDIVPYYSFQSAQCPPLLVCLDATSGRVIWPNDLEAFTEAHSDVSFDSSPIVRQGRLYIVGRRRRSFGFEDCYLYCLRAADGSVEWRTHLGSASTGTFGSRRATMAIAASQGDTIYVCTNLGSIAGVWAHTGAVRWLRTYERRRLRELREFDSPARKTAPWAFNPVILADRRVVCLPTDSFNVQVLAADDGRTLLTVPVEQVGEMETLLGVRGDLLCGVGAEACCYDFAAQELRWCSALPTDKGVFGRGTWVNDRLLVPTRDGLSTFTISSGRRDDSPWDSETRGGNLLALPTQLLVAGSHSVAAFVRRADIWNALRARMEASPLDALPALELAEIALRAGELSEAVEVLDEAVRRVGDLIEPVEPALQRRFFDDVLLFVEVLSRKSRLETGVIDRLFTYASRCAPDAIAGVTYRLRFASLFEMFEQPPRAVRLYQQILRDRSLRDLTAPADAPGLHATGAESAGGLAQRGIAELIEKHGRGIYAPHEADARRLLNSGRRTQDEAILIRVARAFPNSDAAPLALIAHGEMLLNAARPAVAAKRFARAYHRYPGHVNRPGLVRKIADAYEQAGQLENAYRWLTKGTLEHPGVTLKHEGRRITFREYRRRLDHVRSRVEPSRPGIALPLSRHVERDFDGPVSLLTPRFDEAAVMDWSRYYVYTPAGITAFEAGTDAQLWGQPAAVRTNPELLVATAGAAVFATPHEVFALEPSTGARLWSHADYPVDFDEHEADWEDGRRLRTHALNGNRLVSVRDDGRMACIAIDSGELLWQVTHRPAPSGRIRLTDRWVAYHVMQDDHVVVCLVDADSGAWGNAITTEISRTVEDTFIAFDGQLILVTSRSVSAYDVDTGGRRWQTALEGYLRSGSVLLGIDALYYSDNGRELKKINLDDGRVLWQSEPLVRRGEEGLVVRRQGASVIVSTVSSVGAVDEVNGLTLWRGVTPENARFVHRGLTRAYVLAVDVPDDIQEVGAVAYFYDHRNASGLIPKDGGSLPLGDISDIRAVLAIDGALLIQAGSTIHVWTGQRP